MKKLILVLFTWSFITAASAQEDSAKSHAKQLLEVTGVVKVSIQMMNTMFDYYKKNFPAAPDDFWETLSKEIKPEEMLDLIIPLYTKYYTDEELKQLLAFYKTPVGKKVIETLPLLTQESVAIGQEWGKRIGEKVVLKLKAKGIMQSN